MIRRISVEAQKRKAELQNIRRSEMTQEQRDKTRARARIYAARQRAKKSPEDKARAAEYMKRWSLSNPEYRATRLKQWPSSDPAKVKEYMRQHHLWRTYGITQEHYDAMHKAQGGKCAICGADKPGGRSDIWHVDHCHTSGNVRGLLCDRCNRGLGFFRDSTDFLTSAVKYLKRKR